MKAFIAWVKMWWNRRFRGIVKPPPGQQGTTWYQHPEWMDTFECLCNTTLRFAPEDYVIRDQQHADGCQGLLDASTKRIADLATTRIIDLRPCACPVLDARYIKLCPQCKTGHWKQAKTEKP